MRERDAVRRAIDQLGRVSSPVRVRGRVTELTGLVLRACLPNVRVGEMAEIARPGAEPLAAEVVGFRQEEVVLMPLGEPVGVGPDSLVETTGQSLRVACGPALLGRVLDGLGRLIDGGPPLVPPYESWPVERAAPSALQRPRIRRPLGVGIRAIDGLLTLGEGQRVGLFAGSGVGKSTLLGQLARQSEADVCVVCLVGERGREVNEFISDSLGPGLARAVVVCATSDAAPLVRLKSAYVATAVAEYFRDQGQRVLLLMDSVTRFARAQREVGLAAGEPPTRRGYPPSVFVQLPRLLERAGNAANGSITAVYTVLVEGSDLDEPIADEVRGILDGHIVLARELAERNHWPAIDVLRSLSRVMPQIADGQHQRAAARFRELLAAYERQRDLILLGAYERGSDVRTDQAIDAIDALESFLCQSSAEPADASQTRATLVELLPESARAAPVSV